MDARFWNFEFLKRTAKRNIWSFHAIAAGKCYWISCITEDLKEFSSRFWSMPKVQKLSLRSFYWDWSAVRPAATVWRQATGSKRVGLFVASALFFSMFTLQLTKSFTRCVSLSITDLICRATSPVVTEVSGEFPTFWSDILLRVFLLVFQFQYCCVYLLFLCLQPF